MTRAREIRASEQMRDRIADMLGAEAARREAGGDSGRKGRLLRAMERVARSFAGGPAREVGDD